MRGLFENRVVSMANEKNLKPIKSLSKDEAKRRGAKGGKKSAEVRKNKKLLKECMINLLDMQVSDTKKFNSLVNMGLDVEDIDNRALLTVALFKKALMGDVAAFKEIRNLIGEDNSNDGDGKLQELIDGVLKRE